MKVIKLAFEEYGESSHSPLVILHGFFASSRNWRQIAKKLAEYHHVYVLDARNHGMSPHSPEMDYLTMTEDLLFFLDEQKLQTVDILGHSMGGKTAMWFALNNPQRVKNLLIADISPVKYQHSFDNTINALQSIPLDKIANRKQADEFLSSAITELSYRQFLLQNLLLKEGQYSWRVNLDIFYQTADNIIGFPETELISTLQNNSLFIMGGLSNYYNKASIDQHFPNADIAFLKDANHWLHVEQPDAFCTKVIDFLRD